jgi:hypothetical protein
VTLSVLNYYNADLPIQDVLAPHKIDLLYRVRWHLTSTFNFQILGLRTSWLLKLTLACLLTYAAMVAYLLMISAPFGSLNIQSSSASTLGCPWTACDQVLGGTSCLRWRWQRWVFKWQLWSCLRNYQRMRLLLRLSKSCLWLRHSWSGLWL